MPAKVVCSITLSETTIAPENRPSQKESCLPLIKYQGIWFRECRCFLRAAPAIFRAFFRLQNPVPDFFPGAFHREFPGGVSFERGAWVTSMFRRWSVGKFPLFPWGDKTHQPNLGVVFFVGDFFYGFYRDSSPFFATIWVQICFGNPPITYLGVVSNVFYLHPYLGKRSNVANISQMGWFNHQPVIRGLSRGSEIGFLLSTDRHHRIRDHCHLNPTWINAITHLNWAASRISTKLGPQMSFEKHHRMLPSSDSQDVVQ